MTSREHILVALLRRVRLEMADENARRWEQRMFIEIGETFDRLGIPRVEPRERRAKGGAPEADTSNG